MGENVRTIAVSGFSAERNKNTEREPGQRGNLRNAPLPRLLGDECMQKLAKKLLQVMQDCSHIQKNGTNQFHGYKYATSADVLERVNASLVQNGIVSIAKPEVVHTQDVTNARGNAEHLVSVQMSITLIDTESGESLEIQGLGSGQDVGDKAIMKAETAAIKYAYLLTLAVSTGDDPEADNRTDEGMQFPVKNAAHHVAARTISKGIGKNNGSQCADCGTAISDKVHSFSMKRFGLPLCMECQHKHNQSA